MWEGKQVSRYRFLKSYDSLPMQIVRSGMLLTGLVSLLVIFVDLIFYHNRALAGLCLVGLSAGLIVSSFELFVLYVRSHPWYGMGKFKTESIFNNLDFQSLDIIEPLFIKANWSDFWKKLNNDSFTREAIYRLQLDYDSASEIINKLPTDNDFLKNFVTKAISKATALENKIVNPICFVKAAIELPGVASIISSEGLTTEETYLILDYYQERADRLRRHKAFWLADSRVTNGGIAKDWAISYTVFLDRITQDIKTDVVIRNQYSPLYGRDKLVDQIVADLNQEKGQNVLLIAPPGVGKREIFYHVAEKIITGGTDLKKDYQQIRMLDVEQLLSFAGTEDKLRFAMDTLFNEIVKAGNIVLFIPNISSLINPSHLEGTADLSTVLDNYLEDPRVHLVGTITPQDYETLVEPNTSLSTKFATITIDQPDEMSLIKILLDNVPVLENRYKVAFHLTSLKTAVQLSKRYLKKEYSPTREIKLLEEVASLSHSKHITFIEPENIIEAVEGIAKVQIQVKEGEKDTLLNLGTELHKRVISQDNAIKQVSEALLRARAGMTTGEKPLGTFMFLGPTGVGKTETAKALAAIYFGSESKIIRLDMAEYADENGIIKLLGTHQINQPGTLTVALESNPSSVILFDEFEKADVKVRNLLLTILDEGRLTTNFGRVLDFTNSIIIATSNAGSEFISKNVKENPGTFQKKIMDYLISENIFAPELLNRFDGVIVYSALTSVDMAKIVQLQIDKIINNIKAQKNINLKISPNIIEQLKTEGYDPVYGARGLQRLIKEKLETAIARQIITQNPFPGSDLVIESL